jgi:hypothetical protein
MSSKFPLGNIGKPAEVQAGETTIQFADRLKQFAPAGPRPIVDPVELDAAAAKHGFVSREPSPVGIAESPKPSPVRMVQEQKGAGRRRRSIDRGPTRALNFRLHEDEFIRFLSFADRYKLTYPDAIVRLLDIAGEKK